MASSKPKNWSVYGAFCLPVAVLTGLTLSVLLSAALSFLVPVLDSVFFIFLPQLWRAFLSWVTPPCLFVLLNGIIVVLTASSGMLSSPDSDSGSDFYTSVLGKMENSPNASSGALLADLPASASSTILGLKMKDMPKHSFKGVLMGPHDPVVPSQAALPARSAAVRVESHLRASSQAMLHAHTPCVSYDAHGVLEAENGRVVDEGEDGADDENPSNLSRIGAGSINFPHVGSKMRFREGEEEEEEEEEEDDDEDEEEENKDEKISGLPKLDVVNKSFPFGRCRSEPSSPQFATPSKSNTIKRSLSIDSASFNDNNLSSGSPEDLSDEAFRKRVEDFISKMNAQLRSGAKK